MNVPLLHRHVDMEPDRALAGVIDDALQRTSGTVDVRVRSQDGGAVIEVHQDADPGLRSELLRRFESGPDGAAAPSGAAWCRGISALSRRPRILAPWGVLAPADTVAGFGSGAVVWQGDAATESGVVIMLDEPADRLATHLMGPLGRVRKTVWEWVANWFPEAPPGARRPARTRLRVEGRCPPPGAGLFDASRGIFARPAGLPAGTFSWRHPRGTYTGRMRLGVLPQPDRVVSGVTIVLDGRVVVRAEKAPRVGYGTRGRARLPANDASLERLAAVIWLEGQDGVFDQNPAGVSDALGDDALDDIRRRFHEWARPYVAYVRHVPPDPSAMATTPTAEHPEFTHWDGDARETLPALVADPALAEAAFQSFAARRAAGRPEVWAEAWIPMRDAAHDDVIPLSEWQTERRVQVPMSEAAIAAIERFAAGPVSEWLRHAAERELGRHDARWAIPQPEMRPVVDAVVARAQGVVPDALGVAVFGSVVRGEADRASDIDLWVIVREDRNSAQRRLNEAFADFRFPERVGERYPVQALAASFSEAMSHAERGEARFARMLQQAIWLRQGPEIDELLGIGGPSR